MNVSDFRRIALSPPRAEEGSHMGQPDVRVGGHIFATLASAKQGYRNLMLTPKQQAAFVEEMPQVFLPIPGGWGRPAGTGGLRPSELLQPPNPRQKSLRNQIIGTKPFAGFRL